MKIAIYGATGMVGAAVAAEATSRGHEVTGLTRSGGAGLEQAELSDSARFAEIAKAHDAVVIAVAPDRTGGSHEPYVAAVEGVIAAQPAGRVLMVGGAGSLEVNGVALADSPDFPEMFRPEARTMAAVLQAFRAAGDAFSWTVLSPAPMLAPGERTGAYRVGKDEPVGEAISSQDFAIAIVDELENPQHVGERFTVAT